GRISHCGPGRLTSVKDVMVLPVASLILRAAGSAGGEEGVRMEFQREVVADEAHQTLIDQALLDQRMGEGGEGGTGWTLVVRKLVKLDRGIGPAHRYAFRLLQFGRREGGIDRPRSRVAGTAQEEERD